MSSLLPYFHNSCPLHRLLHLQEARGSLRTLKKANASVLKQFVRIEISAAVMVIHVAMVASTTSAASVMSITKLKTNENVLQPSISNANNNERLQLIAAGHKAQQAQAAGPHQLKHKLQTLSCYIAYTLLSITSGPKYLTGACHFLHELFPNFNNNRANPSV
jgi:hypothetical protein